MILEIKNLWKLFLIQIFLLLNGWMRNQWQKWKFCLFTCLMNYWRASLWGLTLSLTQCVELSDPWLMVQAGTMVLFYFFTIIRNIQVYSEYKRAFNNSFVIASRMSLNRFLTFFLSLFNFQSVLTKAICLLWPLSLCPVNWTLTVTRSHVV